MPEVNIPAELLGHNGAPPVEAPYLYRLDAFRQRNSSESLAKGTTVENRNVGVGAKTIGEYKTFLDGYVKDLLRLRDKYPTILQTPGHQDEARLLSILGDEDDSARSEKIDQFLKTPPGLVLATQAMEGQTRKMLDALALVTVSDTPAVREQRTPVSQTYQTGEGMGGLRRLWEDKLKGYRNRIAAVTTASGVAGLIGGLSYGALGAVGGAAAVPPLAAAGIGIHNSWAEGETYQLNRSTDAFLVLKNSPNYAAERDYVKEMFQIDLDDFQVNPVTHTLRYTPHRIEESTGFHELDRAVKQNLKTRKDFLRNLGISNDRLDTLPEEFLTRSRVDSLAELRPEQTDLRMQNRLFEIFDLQHDVKDIHGNDVASGHIDLDHLDVEGNLRRLDTARVQLMTEMAQEYVERAESEKVPNRERPISTLEQKATNYGNGTEKTAKAKELGEHISTFNDEKNEAHRLLEQFGQLDAKKNALEEIVKELRGHKFEITLPPVPSLRNVLDATTDKINDLNTELTGGGGIEDQLAAKQTDYKNAFDAAMAPYIGARNVPRDAVDRAKEVAEAAHGGQLQRLKQQKEEINQKINRLKELRDNYREGVEEKNKAEREVTGIVPKELGQMQADYDFYVTAAGATITDNDLRTLSMDDLISRATAAAPAPYHEPYKTFEQQQALREKLLRAKAEAQARQVETYDRSPQEQVDRFDEVTTVAGATITPEDLIKMPDQQLLHLLYAPPYSWDPSPAYAGSNLDALYKARAEAQKKLLIRDRVFLQDKEKDLETQIKETTKEMDGEQEKAKDQMKITADLLHHQEHIFSHVKDIVSDKDVEKFMNVQKVSTAKSKDTTYSQAEKDLKAPKGYYAFLNLMFDYQEKADRNEYFKKLESVLPPKDLARMLNDSLNLDLGPHPVIGLFMGTPPMTPDRRGNLQAVLGEINTRIQDRRINWRQMRQAMVYIMNRLSDEALAKS